MSLRAAEVLARRRHEEIAGLVGELARAWPEEPALFISLALTEAAGNLEDNLASEASLRIAMDGYRLAALVAADVAALEAMGILPASGRHLLIFWRRIDPTFFKETVPSF